MLFKRNEDIRLEAKGKGIPLWIVAEELRVSEGTLLNWLRKELPAEKRAEILQIIERLGGEK